MGTNRTESSGNVSFFGIADGKITRKITKEELPSQYDPKMFRIRTGTKPDGDSFETVEEIFDSISGQLVDVSFNDTPFNTKNIRVKLIDGDESFIVNVPFDNGRLNQYGVDFIGRLCTMNPEDWYEAQVTLWPYKIAREDKEGKWNVGISLKFEGGKIKSAFAREGRLADQLPEPVLEESRGKKTWNYKAREDKIYEFAERFVGAFTQLAAKDALDEMSPQEEPVNAELAGETDDLPF